MTTQTVQEIIFWRKRYQELKTAAWDVINGYFAGTEGEKIVELHALLMECARPDQEAESLAPTTAGQ